MVNNIHFAKPWKATYLKLNNRALLNFILHFYFKETLTYQLALILTPNYRTMSFPVQDTNTFYFIFIVFTFK